MNLFNFQDSLTECSCFQFSPVNFCGFCCLLTSNLYREYNMKLFFLRQFVQNMQIKNKIHLITCQLLFDLGVLFYFFLLKKSRHSYVGVTSILFTSFLIHFYCSYSKTYVCLPTLIIPDFSFKASILLTLIENIELLIQKKNYSARKHFKNFQILISIVNFLFLLFSSKFISCLA